MTLAAVSPSTPNVPQPGNQPYEFPCQSRNIVLSGKVWASGVQQAICSAFPAPPSQDPALLFLGNIFLAAFPVEQLLVFNCLLPTRPFGPSSEIHV